MSLLIFYYFCSEILQYLPAFKTEIQEEYELMLVCGNCAGIIEVRFKTCQNTVPELLKKAETLRLDYPMLKNCEIYLGLAALTFDESTEKECFENGIAVIKEIDGTIIIEDTTSKFTTS